MKQEKFEIQGMTCSSCSAHVERATKKLEGVKSANVNLLSNHMVVEYDETMLRSDSIIQAVIEAGYGAKTSEEKKKSGKVETKQNYMQDSIKSMKKRLLISVCFLIPLMYIAMHHMFYEWFGLPIPAIIQNIFAGEENALTFGLTQFLLLLPILYENRNYFIVRLKKTMEEVSQYGFTNCNRKFGSPFIWDFCNF